MRDTTNVDDFLNFFYQQTPLAQHKGDDPETIIKTRIEELFNKPITAQHNIRKSASACQYNIYTIPSFNQLVQETQHTKFRYVITLKQKPDPEQLRFAEAARAAMLDQTVDYELLFGEEKNKMSKGPAHGLMPAKTKIKPDDAFFVVNGYSRTISQSTCLCAGNIVLDPSCTQVIEINTQSGDFRPSLDRLLFALAQFVALDEQKLIHLADNVTIGNGLNICQSVRREILGEAIHRLFTQEQLNQFVEINRVAEMRQVQFLAPETVRKLLDNSQPTATETSSFSRRKIAMKPFSEMGNSSSRIRQPILFDLSDGSQVKRRCLSSEENAPKIKETSTKLGSLFESGLFTQKQSTESDAESSAPSRKDVKNEMQSYKNQP